jgi:CelD/BcsL family acetyltransferase involved in cellulose biosynthesis
MVQVLESLQQEINSVSSNSKKLEIRILTEEEALAQLKVPSFLSAWERLYMNCEWGTVFQSPTFVKNWYELYAIYYKPILVLAYADNALVGLLPLTHQRDGKIILGAGLGSAEYHTWLANEIHATNFIQQALRYLFRAFPGFQINLYNVAPNSPISWVTDEPYWKQRTVVKKLRRPLMHLCDPEVDKIFRKKQFREKTNRLKRLGNLKFEKVTDPDHFKAILDELIAQSDFRKGAKFNLLQFEADPLGRDFLLRLFEEGMLHTTILSLNGKILSSIAAVEGKQWVHLAGLNSYTPLLAKHSPGTINFILLGQLLREEQVRYFDLTPGGDAYKERLATTHDHVHELYFASPLITARRKLIEGPLFHLIKNIPRFFKKTPREFKFELIKVKSRLGLAAQRKQLHNFSPSYLLTGRGTSTTTLLTHSLSGHTPVKVRLNQVEDLLLYKMEDGVSTRWDFLSDAMNRFEAGQTLYTSRSNDLLTCSVWLTEEMTEAGESYSDLSLSGLHCHKDHLHLLPDFIHSVANSMKQTVQNPNLQVYLKVDKRASHILPLLSIPTKA